MDAGGDRLGAPATDSRVEALNATALAHRVSGLESVTGEHYEGGHWLGSFAVYLVTRRGLCNATGAATGLPLG